MMRRWSVVLVGACVILTVISCGGANAPAPAATTAPAPQAAAPTAPSQADIEAMAKAMVGAALVKAGDRVVVSGSVRDNALLEELAVEAMKAGGQPVITIGSDKLARRSYDDVPAAFDAQPPAMDLAMANVVDVSLSVETGEAENLLTGVPPARIAARNKAALEAAAVRMKRGVRSVNLGNGLYPTAALAARLGKSQADLAAVFWKAAVVSPETLRAKGGAILAALATAKQVTLSDAAGTKLTVGIDAARASVSDGAMTPEKVKAGRAAVLTWLPAGEVLIPVKPGTAEGTVVVEKYVQQGEVIEGLTLTFSKGKLTNMTARSGLGGLKAFYDATTGAKDEFAYLDLGLNPEVTLPTNTGRVIWMAAGGVTIGVGDNTEWGGSNVSNFALAGAVTRATLAADGKALIENGVLK